ncbi:MAG: ParB/RepB/Spo0J family partition protein [Treponema sp.]|nr:ParB/RepB/Spo0J family partition protein [Treponema sp.]
MAKLTALTKNTSGLNSGAEVMAQRISLDKITVHPTFQTLLPINEKELANIVKDMEENGFDKSKPVCIWREENVLIDGYTRFTAAKEAGLSEIYKYEMSFGTEQEALEYAMKQQLNRRNLNDAGKIMLIEKLDNLRNPGRKSSDPEADAEPRGKSAQALAESLGIGTRTVERARHVLANADEETLEEVKSGKTSINQAAKKIKQQKDEEKKAAAPVDVPVPEEEPAPEFDWSDMDIDFDEVDNFDEDSAEEKDEDVVPLQFQPTWYEHIMEFDLHHLAVYLASIQQEEPLSISQWEEKLKTRGTE